MINLRFVHGFSAYFGNVYASVRLHRLQHLRIQRSWPDLLHWIDGNFHKLLAIVSHGVSLDGVTVNFVRIIKPRSLRQLQHLKIEENSMDPKEALGAKGVPSGSLGLTKSPTAGSLILGATGNPPRIIWGQPDHQG